MARVALVTGGTRGIGEAIAVALKKAGLQGRGQLCRQRRGGARPSAAETGIPAYNSTSATSRRARRR